MEHKMLIFEQKTQQKLFCKMKANKTWGYQAPKKTKKYTIKQLQET